MNFQLTEEQQLIEQSAREFAKEFLDPIAAELDSTGEFPKAIVKELASHDFLGLHLPAEAGGAGAGFVSYVAVIESLSRSCSAVASIINNQAMVSYAIQRWGTTAQKQQYISGLIKGDLLGAFAIYEFGPTPGIGSDAVVATKTQNGYQLKGTKAYVRNAGEAAVYVVFAVTDPAQPKALTGFVVDATTPGLKVGPKHTTMGLRGCPVADVVFDNVALPDSAVLGAVKQGTEIVGNVLTLASIAEAAQTVGIGQAAVEHAAAYAKQRIQFGKPVFNLQAVKTLLADAATDCYLARLGLFSAAQLVEDGKPFENEAAMLKTFLARLGSKILIDTVQVEGGMGFTETMPLPRLYRDIAGTTLLDAPADYPDEVIAANIN
jgi:alkylation response protein AidB-like acyl-CoA dehydrogenase